MSDRGVRLVRDADLPGWLRPVVRGVDGARVEDLFPWRPEPDPMVRRQSAVLMALAQGSSGPDVLLTARAATLRAHAGQPAFPGGRSEPGEDPVTTALREANEETGLDPAGVTAVAMLPDLYLPPSGFRVAPVLGHWHSPNAVRVIDLAETAAVARVPLAELAAPANRGRVRHPNGAPGPAFAVAGMLVWGFTAALVDLLLRLGGWSTPWDENRLWPLESALGSVPPGDPEIAEIS